MCKDCGCDKLSPHTRNAAGATRAGTAPAETIAAHAHEHTHDNAAAHRTLDVRESVLSHNDRLAERNRGLFLAHRLAVINVLSAPGAGKTTLLQRTLADNRARWRMAVVVGDLATDNDARRLREAGAPAVQIVTGTACHLDAHMIRHALDDLDPAALDLLFIENVGNLVCPAEFDLGERARAVVLSVTEGEDKPLKYPVIFHDADAVLLSKTDIAEATGFQRDAALTALRAAAPLATVMELSARTGAGMAAWYAWLDGQVQAAKNAG